MNAACNCIFMGLPSLLYGFPAIVDDIRSIWLLRTVQIYDKKVTKKRVKSIGQKYEGTDGVFYKTEVVVLPPDGAVIGVLSVHPLYHHGPPFYL